MVAVVGPCGQRTSVVHKGRWLAHAAPDHEIKLRLPTGHIRAFRPHWAARNGSAAARNAKIAP
jgi:hypothetical protein